MHVFICPNLIFKILEYSLSNISKYSIYFISDDKLRGAIFGFDMNIHTQISAGKNFKVDDSKFSLIGINLSFIKNLKNTITMFLKLHP